MVRWIATVYYRTENGIVDVEHQLEDIIDLDELVENGPHFDTIINIDIRRVNHSQKDTLTIEESTEL